MNIQRISPMAYATVLEMASRNYTGDFYPVEQGPWLWMVEELGWERKAAWLTLLDACDPFQDAAPCWQAATPYTLTGKRNKPTYHTAGDYKGN